jgi:putative intracellular protease/amidase
MTSGKVLLVVASEGYQQVEYGVSKKILEEAGFQVITASNKKVPAIAKDGTSTDVDVVLENVKVEDYNGIFFIGGPGALDALDNSKSYRIIKEAAAKKMPFGAICISTRILAKAGVLKNKEATGWDGDGELKKVYDEYAISLSKKNVVTDGNIVTAVGPQNAQEFATQIIAVLQDNKGWG